MPDQNDVTPESPGADSDVLDEASQILGEEIEDDDDEMPEEPVRPRELTPHDAAALARIREIAREAAGVASALKGEDIRILTMHDTVSYTDFLVLCTGRSTRQTRRIADEIGVRLKKGHDGLLPHSVEGDRTGEWVLMDYLDFIVHIFTPETRDFYRLDNLWKSAPVEEIE
jgi:ribosome-associated protein